ARLAPSPQPSPHRGEGVRREIDTAETGMMRFLLPLSDPAAADAERVGPKAANLAALAQAGLPTPGGCCLTAAAYRRQIAHLGLTDALHDYAEANPPLERRLAVEIR